MEQIIQQSKQKKHWDNNLIMKNNIIFFLIFFTTTLVADERTIKLDRLFNDLKINNSSIGFEIEQKIWKMWSTHPYDNKLTNMLADGSDLVNNQKLYQAIDIFSKVIELDPNWAEGWNKRATVLYMMGNFELSQNDIDMVLSLEKRHFGALSGQGLVQTALQNYQKAIDSYIEAHKIYPSSQSTLQMIEQLNILIQKESI